MSQTATRVVRRIPSEALFTTGQYRKPQMVVAAYARVSTEKEEQEDSFDRQVQHYTNLITSKPEWQFGGIYADPGITGTRAEKRPDFMRMIQACRDGKINKVLVKSISRFARNTVDALNYIRMFDMAQAEMQRRRDEKVTSVGSSRYTSKYPLSGLLVCGTCGHRLRRHVRTVGSGKRVAAWGCTNRISNGRSVCDSHHINEDVLERTIRAAFDGMEDVLDVVEESCAEVLEADNHTELEQVQQDIIAIQEAVLALHKAQQQGAVSEMDYEIKISSYSQQMDELQERQRELKAMAGRFAEVKYWMDAFKEHVHSGEKMDTTDAVVLRRLTDRIVVYEDRLEIHLRIGGALEQKYK